MTKILVDGADLRCTQGSVAAKLVIPQSRGAVGEAPMATAKDSLPLVNITPFGNCAALLGAPCGPTIIAAWLSPSSVFEIDGSPVLTERSTCVCTLGGIIRPVEAAQDRLDEVAASTHVGAGEDGQGGPALLGARRKSEKKPPETVRLVLDDALFGPARGALVRLTFDDGSSKEFATDHLGVVTFETGHTFVHVAVQTHEGTREMFVFLLLPPANSPAGIWQRLANLGYVSMRPPPEAPPSPNDLTMAVQEFQADHGLPVSGQADARTFDQIRVAHDDDNRPWNSREWAPIPTVAPGAPQIKASRS